MDKSPSFNSLFQSPKREPSPLPCNVREIEKDELISRLASPPGLPLDSHKEKVCILKKRRFPDRQS